MGIRHAVFLAMHKIRLVRREKVKNGVFKIFETKVLRLFRKLLIEFFISLEVSKTQKFWLIVFFFKRKTVKVLVCVGLFDCSP